MKKIAMIGLKGSGKTCFTTAMSMAMSSGIKLEDGSVFNLSFANLQQMAPLMNAYLGMTNDRRWPEASDVKNQYDFNSCLSLRRVLPFTLLDYPGGWLTDPEHMNEMFEEFNECGAIIVLIGADMLIELMNGNVRTYPYFSMLRQFTQNVIEKFDQNGLVFPPTIIAITKSDEFEDEGKIGNAYEFLKEQFAAIFAVGTNIVSGLTHIKLGNNLRNNEAYIEGDLILKPDFGNLSIPILFSFYATALTNRDNVAGEGQRARYNLIRAQNQNMFERLRDRLAGNRRTDTLQKLRDTVQGTDEQYSNLCKLIESIEPTLLNGAELYYDGNRINKK